MLTHYHTDHSGGLAGYTAAAGTPTLRATARTRDLVFGGGAVAPVNDEALTRAFADVADRAALTRYLALLDDIDVAARHGHKTGTPAAQLSGR